jgi:cyclic pyranopterin phosphate synthase
VRLGVRKIRLTGGEPLVRKGVIAFARGLARHLGHGLDELTLTTNATRLAEFAPELADLGVRRINISLDSLRPQVFARVTRGGDLARVLAGVDAAQASGLAIKINIVALKDHNADEIEDIIAWAHGRGFDASLIEVMPMGETGEDRRDQFLSLADVRHGLERRWTLRPITHSTGGPSRYVEVVETGGRLGFITPLSHVFCEDCNRVRLTASGKLFLCLGQNENADLAAVLRAGGNVEDAIRSAIGIKPERHDFSPDKLSTPALARRMSETGG